MGDDVFVLDREENPHPRMCAATGCDEAEMIACLDSHQWRRGVGG